MLVVTENFKEECECLRFCKVLDGTRIYLFKRIAYLRAPYVVAVRKDVQTLSFHYYMNIKNAVQNYLEEVCCYA